MTDRSHRPDFIRYVIGLLILFTGLFFMFQMKSSQAMTLPDPATDTQAVGTAGTQTAFLSGGCFWGMQAVFEHVKGVTSVVAGYSGGAQQDATYESVSTGTTGHAESVEITYNPKEISYGQLLKIYFSVAHDPTELNQQGPDTGTQYRSVIFYATPEQKRVAQAYIDQLQKAKIFSSPIVTQVSPFNGFYTAEDYHQDYAKNHPDNLYIRINDLPKVADLKSQFPQLYVETLTP